MAATHGLGIDILCNQYDVTAYFNSLSVGQEGETAEVQTFGDTWKRRIPGLKDGSFAADGIFDGAAGAIDAILSPLLNVADSLFSAAWAGFGTIGNRAVLLKGILTKYDTTGDTGSAVSTSMEVTPNDGVHRGWVLRDLATRTSTSAGATANSIDTTTTSSTGYVANAHTTAGTGTQDIKLVDSSDNSSFADVTGATFTQQTGATSQQIRSNTQTVRRYVAATLTLASSPSFTTAITFAKL